METHHRDRLPLHALRTEPEGNVNSLTMEGSHPRAGDRLRDLLRRYGVVTILLVSLGVLWWGMHSAFSIGVVGNALYVSVIVLILAAEFWIPFRPEWGTIRNVTRPDVAYFLITPLTDALQMALLIGMLSATAQYHHYLEVVALWPNHWPILAQLLLAILTVDFFKYWYHRWTHTVPLLWRMHIIHHCIERLQMLRASYFFPLDVFLTVATGTAVMLAIGCSYELIVFQNVFTGILGLLNHSNADWKCPYLDTFVNTPDHHRAHHSVYEPGVNSNYGSFFNYADRMFGTRFLPKPEEITDLGLDDSWNVPDTLLRQLAVPFRWSEVIRRV